MGVVRYLCITIVLAYCLAYANAASCVAGAPNNNGTCICQSGYTGPACADAYGSTNAANALCAANYAAALNNKDDRFPVLDTTLNKMTFTQNTVKLSIVGQVVPNRTYTNVYFVQPTAANAPAVIPQCSLNTTAGAASFWTQHMDTSCHDQFLLTMYWGHWADCGFTQSDDSIYYIYRATFLITYVDSFAAPFSYPDEPTPATLYRRSSVSYKVWVKFLKQITIDVQQSLITVNNTVGLKIALTKFEYDPSDMTLTLGISSGVLWPNMLVRSTVNITINDKHNQLQTTQGKLGLPVNVNDVTNDVCDMYSGNCLQYFEFQVSLMGATNCSFDAVYRFDSTAATCRDHPQMCTQALEEAWIEVTNSDVCGSVTADPVITGALRSYDMNNVASSEFTIGYGGIFAVDMVTANDFNLTWIDIWVVPDDYPLRPQYLYKGGQTQVSNFYKADGTTYNAFPSSPVALVVYDVTQNVDPAHRVFTPRFTFNFDSRIFNVPFSQSADGLTTRGFTLHAIGHIVYAGNEQYGKKREVKVVDYVYQTSAADMAASVPFGLSNQMPEAVAASDKSSTAATVNNTLLKSLVPIAGIALVVIAAAVVAAVVISKRRSARSFATLSN